MNGRPQPLQSLENGHWFKLICGASYQHLPAVRTLTLAYTLAGADCIDVAADPAVVHAARNAIVTAGHLQAQFSHNPPVPHPIPWLMVSLNDGEDPHFRKADFNPAHCPAGLSPTLRYHLPRRSDYIYQREHRGDHRTLLRLWPLPTRLSHSAHYHHAPSRPTRYHRAVNRSRTRGRVRDPHPSRAFNPTLRPWWQKITPYIDQLKLLAISCQEGDGVLEYLRSLYDRCSPLPCSLGLADRWQTHEW